MIILASASPRRLALLRRVVPEFKSEPANIDERALPMLAPAPYVQSLAQAKAAAVACRHPSATVIAADTMVAFGDELLGKPANRAAARAMLQALSGRTHAVHTGLVVRWPDGREVAQVVTTQVTFWPLSAAAIDRYLATNEWVDKAGGYGIQGAGALLVQGVNGDFYNVMGLPISTLARILN